MKHTIVKVYVYTRSVTPSSVHYSSMCCKLSEFVWHNVLNDADCTALAISPQLCANKC